MHLAWQQGIGPGNQAQPLLITGVAGHTALLIVVSGKNLYALDGQTGSQVWETTFGGQYYGLPGQGCGEAGIAGTPGYVASLGELYVAAGNNDTSPNHVIVSKVDVATGHVSGTVDVTPSLLTGELTASHSGMVYANGKLYLGTASNCEEPSWRGRLLAIDPSSLTVTGTFFTTYGQGGNFGGGGIWSWGGPSVDSNGNVYVASGNAETPNTTNGGTIQSPFVSTTNEAAGYAEHVVQLSSDLSTVKQNDAPMFNFAQGYADLDFSGTPVLFQPNGCDMMTGTQGKGGTLVLNDTANMTTPQSFMFSQSSGAADYIGNPAYSPSTQFLYAPIASGRNTMYKPGMAALQLSCPGGSASLAWTATFGPDSFSYGGTVPRSAPAVTAGGVVFQGTPCTADGKGGCTTPSGSPSGAEWAVDASTGAVLHGGTPVLSTTGNIRMPAMVDGSWVYVMDNNGNLYAMTTDPSVKAVQVRKGVGRAASSPRYPN